MSASTAKARERAYKRLIKTAHDCADAISLTLEYHPAERPDDYRLKLGRELREQAGYLEQATWWRA